MRLWSLHPKYLDHKRLVAVWREGLLARKVLEGNTKGYRNHPQLIRFREQADPLASIGAFLAGILSEADARGYHFDRSKLPRTITNDTISVTASQLAYELDHLLAKLGSTIGGSSPRPPPIDQDLRDTSDIECHPLFHVIPGDIEAWEVGHWRRSQNDTIK
jgi:hypothetical protein